MTGRAGQAALPSVWSTMPVFTPPTNYESWARDRFWSRVKMNHGTTVLKTGGSYRTIESPDYELVAAADIVYFGGRSYWISSGEAASLTSAGYGAYIS